MLTSLIQSNPVLVQQMGRAFQQVLIEKQRMEKLASLKVCSHCARLKVCSNWFYQSLC